MSVVGGLVWEEEDHPRSDYSLRRTTLQYDQLDPEQPPGPADRRPRWMTEAPTWWSVEPPWIKSVVAEFTRQQEPQDGAENNIIQRRRRPVRHPEANSVLSQCTNNTNESVSSESSNSLRAERPLGTIRVWKDDDSDVNEELGDQVDPDPVTANGPNPSGITRAILLQSHTQERHDNNGQGNATANRRPCGPKVEVFDFIPRSSESWETFCDGLEATISEGKFFIVILEGSPTTEEVAKFREVKEFRRGAGRFFRKTGSERLLPSRCGEDLIFDSPFLYTKDWHIREQSNPVQANSHQANQDQWHLGQANEEPHNQPIQPVQRNNGEQTDGGADVELPQVQGNPRRPQVTSGTTNPDQDNLDPLFARYARVWISNIRLFAMIHDWREGLSPPASLPPGWVSERRRVDEQPQEDNVPNVPMEGGEQQSIATLLVHHFRVSGRWARYESSGWWLASDVYNTLYINRWNKAHDQVAATVEKYRERVIVDFTSAPITQLSSSLHIGQSRLLNLLELQRYQGAVFQRIDLFLNRKGAHHYPEGVRYRIQSMIQQTELMQRAIDLLLKKVDDSLNLLFNITTVNEARAVNRLTYLAFFYVPLSFATSVWGMTQFQVAAQWVAALALPLLVLTLILVALSHVLARKLDDRKMKQIRKRCGLPV